MASSLNGPFRNLRTFADISGHIRVDDRRTINQLTAQGDTRLGRPCVGTPARNDTRFPVSCVEHGRWDYRSGRRFAASLEFSPSTLRAIKTASVSARRRSMGDHRSDQVSVWTEVARKQAMLGSSSATGAMRDVYEQRALGS